MTAEPSSPPKILYWIWGSGWLFRGSRSPYAVGEGKALLINDLTCFYMLYLIGSWVQLNKFGPPTKAHFPTFLAFLRPCESSGWAHGLLAGRGCPSIFFMLFFPSLYPLTSSRSFHLQINVKEKKIMYIAFSRSYFLFLVGTRLWRWLTHP